MSEDPELDARPVNVQELFGQPAVRYVTPDFQRPFEWAEEQFGELWHDIKTAAENSSTHFLGQVILVETNGMDSQTMQIIDGQQRFTSISILVCALRDYYRKRGETGKADQLSGLLEATAISDAKKKRRLKLLNHDRDDAQYDEIYNSNAEEADGKVAQAYEFFQSKLQSSEEKLVDSVRATLLKDVKLIRTETGDINSAYQVFQTENDRGMDLSPIDLAKSMLFEAAAKDPDTNSESIKESWLDIVSRLDRVDNAGARRPVQHILGVSDFECSVQLYPKQFVRVFQDVLRNQLAERGITLAEFVDFLETEADIYLQANAAVSDEVSNNHSTSLNRQTAAFRYKNSHGGVVAYFIHKQCGSEQEIIKALELATILNVRLNLSDKTASNKRDPLYQIATKSDQYDILERIKGMIRRTTPTDNALFEHVANRKFKQNKITELVLLELEREHFSSNHRSMTVDDFQIEHIAPRKAFSDDQYTAWRSKFGHDGDKFKEYRGRLGNLTPLASKQNARAGAKPLESKKPEYRSSEFGLTQKVCDYDDWGYEQIEARTNELAELVVETWSIE